MKLWSDRRIPCSIMGIATAGLAFGQMAGFPVSERRHGGLSGLNLNFREPDRAVHSLWWSVRIALSAVLMLSALWFVLASIWSGVSEQRVSGAVGELGSVGPPTTTVDEL